jgi:hypothetical protein
VTILLSAVLTATMVAGEAKAAAPPNRELQDVLTASRGKVVVTEFLGLVVRTQPARVALAGSVRERATDGRSVTLGASLSDALSTLTIFDGVHGQKCEP